MMFSPGSRLGPYEIVALLGSGGMGEVYRARDPRLGRDLALKVLSGKLSADREALERFEREARAASALNHPNVVTIYDVGEHQGSRYIAMELVEGRSLRRTLAERALSIRDVLDIAMQVTDALASLHERGIIHRDLKPENIMISESGLVKLLDFGISKLALAEVATTTTIELFTQPGVLLGTVSYMSPEQAAGGSVDFYSDQFSFGAVLYEMLTGKPPFESNTAVETLAAILREEQTRIAQPNPGVPAPLFWIVERCLAKAPAGRYASTRDLASDVAAVRDRLSGVTAEPAVLAPALPVPRTRLIGRERELETVRNLLLHTEVRLVTLTGAGGSGKTRLALQAASEAKEGFKGGVWFVSLGSIYDAGLVPSTIAQALGVRPAAGKPIEDCTKDAFRDSQRVLLVLDNFEQVLPAAASVAALLEACAALKVLVTSRAPLHIYGEHEFAVQPLRIPELQQPVAPEMLLQVPAVALFLDRATAIRPDLVRTDENVRAAAEICARVDGLPLAIELAAARVKVLPPPAMLARMQSRLELLTGGARDLPARQQTLRRTIEWSYHLLDPEERKLFARLSVFVGGCTLEAAEAVGNPRGDLEAEVLETLSALVDKSLLRQSEDPSGEPRFMILETIREYGLERLTESGEEKSVCRAHAAYFMVLAEDGSSPGAMGVEEERWLDRVEIELDNLRAALDWLTRSGSAEWGLRLATALFRFWDTRGHRPEGGDRLVALLALPGPGRTGLRARALFAAGILAPEPLSLTFQRESLEITRELGDKRASIMSLSALAGTYQYSGDYTRARPLYEEAAELAHSLADPVVTGRILNNFAVMTQEQGDYKRARSLYEESLAFFLQAGDRHGLASGLNHLGDLASEERNYPLARSLYERSLAAFRELGDRWGISGTLADLGDLARDQGDHSLAQSQYRESLRMFQQLKHDRGISRLLESFAISAAALGRAERALRLAGAAAGLRRRLGLDDFLVARRRRLSRSLDQARAELDGARAAAAWMEGWAMKADHAVEYALAQEVV
jgi:predicted ATPase